MSREIYLKEIGMGIITGIESFIGGFVLTYLLLMNKIEKFFRQSGVGMDITKLRNYLGEQYIPADIDIILWFHARAHTITYNLEGASAFGGSAGREIDLTASTIWMDSLFLIPILILFVAGFWLSRRFSFQNITQVVSASIPLAVAYGVTAYIAYLLSMWIINLGIAHVIMAPNVNDGLLWLGGVPLVCSTAGMLVEMEIRE